jgi:hypothetical protein
MTVFRYVGAAALLALAAPAAAQGAHLACGATITSDTRVRTDLRDCPGDGLVIGADHGTLDLGRSTLDGAGTGAGISLSGHRGVTIKGGTIQEFTTGVALDGASANRLSGTTVRANAERGVDALNGSDGNTFERVTATGNRTGMLILASNGNDVRMSSLSANAVTGVAVVGGNRNRVRASRVTDNAANGVAFVEGSTENAALANTVRGGETGLIVDSSDRNLFSLNHVSGAGDGILLAGNHNTVAGNVIDRSTGGCETCAGHGIGVLSGDHNVIKANVVTRSASDGINIGAAGTWVGLTLAVRNGGLGIRAVPGTHDGGGNRSTNGCSGVRCTPRAKRSRPTT